MKKIIILKGLPACGKTTWAKELIQNNPGSYKRVNKDDLRDMLDNGRWSSSNEKYVLRLRDEIIMSALEDGKHVIVDDTNLHPKHETHIKQLVKGKAQVEIKFFDVDVDECILRDSKRTNSVGKKIIMDMYNKFLHKEEKIVQDTALPGAYIFDIDGTLAKMTGRSPYDYSRVSEDALNMPVYRVMKELSRSAKIVIFTGRDGSCEAETKQWLEDNNIQYDAFAIRDAGDRRKDYIIKKEMVDLVIDKYYIRGVFDDRNQVVEMWRSIGLTCFQVADGNF